MSQVTLYLDDETDALLAHAASASGLYRDVKIDLRRHPWVEWRWKVDDAVAGSRRHLGQTGAHDAGAQNSHCRDLCHYHTVTTRCPVPRSGTARLCRVPVRRRAAPCSPVQPRA